jgi:hypothetical protein
VEVRPSAAQKHAQAQAARAGLLERFHLAHAHVDAELVAFADDGFGVAGAGLHGQRDHVGGQGFKVEFGWSGWGAVQAWVNSNKKFITRHGAERAVLLSIGDYRALTAHKPDLKEYLLGGPKVDSFEIERDRDVGREIDL